MGFLNKLILRFSEGDIINRTKEIIKDYKTVSYSDVQKNIIESRSIKCIGDCNWQNLYHHFDLEKVIEYNEGCMALFTMQLLFIEVLMVREALQMGQNFANDLLSLIFSNCKPTRYRRNDFESYCYKFNLFVINNLVFKKDEFTVDCLTDTDKKNIYKTISYMSIAKMSFPPPSYWRKPVSST